METSLNQLVAGLAGPGWLAEWRAAAAARVESEQLPTTAQEVWRYTPIDELDIGRFAPIAAPPAGGPSPASLPGFAGVERSALVVVRDGTIVHVDVDPAAAAAGLVVVPLDETADAFEGLGRAIHEEDAFTLRNDALATPVLVRAPANAVFDRPVVIVQEAVTAGSATFPRLVVDAGRSAELTVLDVATSPDIEALVVPIVEIYAGENAAVRYQAVQDHGPRVWQLGTTGAHVERDARLLVATVALGGAYARIRTDSRVMGAGGKADLVAAYFGASDQIHDFRTLQDHHAPNTESDLLFKGAVTDGSRSVYSGLIRIRPGARGTAAFQTNRNLVLGEGAHADSVPNLEIEENDVRCSHASAVGPVDEDQRYYLEARGVPTDVAERLIVLGFFDDVIDRMPVKELGDPLRAAFASKFEGSQR